MFHIFKDEYDSNWDTECGADYRRPGAVTLGFWLRRISEFADRPCPDCEAKICPLKILACTDL